MGPRARRRRPSAGARRAKITARPNRWYSRARRMISVMHAFPSSENIRAWAAPAFIMPISVSSARQLILRSPAGRGARRGRHHRAVGHHGLVCWPSRTPRCKAAWARRGRISVLDVLGAYSRLARADGCRSTNPGSSTCPVVSTRAGRIGIARSGPIWAIWPSTRVRRTRPLAVGPHTTNQHAHAAPFYRGILRSHSAHGTAPAILTYKPVAAQPPIARRVRASDVISMPRTIGPGATPRRGREVSPGAAAGPVADRVLPYGRKRRSSARPVPAASRRVGGGAVSPASKSWRRSVTRSP